MATYNQYYQIEDYFGKPYPELITYFDKLDRHLKVLDLGCGQGRDSLALGRLGFSVLGVDLSSVGINQLNEIASKEKLNVKGIVGNLNSIDFLSDYDVILLDSMFHFYKKDLKKETELLYKMMRDLKSKGRIVIILQENKTRVNLLKEIVLQNQDQFKIEYEKHFIYQEFNSHFYMIVIYKD